MADFIQLPAVLALSFVQGDQVDIALDFATNLTGYTFESRIYVVKQTVPALGGAAVPTAGQTAATPTVGIVNLTLGKLSIGLTETQTASLSPLGTYRWYFRWVAPGTVTQTILAGDVTVESP
jgi:hypothetical protein